MAKDNTTIYLAAGAAALFLFRKQLGIGGMKTFSLYREDGSDYIHINSTQANNIASALRFFKTHSNLLINTRAGNKYVIIDEDKVKRLSILDIMYKR